METRRKAHISRQTSVKSSAVDVRLTAEQYGPSHLHIRTEWHYHCTLFAAMARGKSGIDLPQRRSRPRGGTRARACAGAAAS
jgi:hypothetical protein